MGAPGRGDGPRPCDATRRRCSGERVAYLRTPQDNCGPECSPWPVRFHSGIPRLQEECLVIGTYNDFEGVERLVRENAGELAAIITEPCMANSGVIPPLPGWNEHLRDLCNQYG